MIKRIMLGVMMTSLLAVAAGSAAQAAQPKWYVGKSIAVVTETTPVVLSGKLTFHYSDPEGNKVTTKCLATGEGTISNSGLEGLGEDEITSAMLSGCVNSRSVCVNKEVQQELFFPSFYFPWGSRLSTVSPGRDEVNFREVSGYCNPPGAHAISAAGIVTPLVKGGALKFDKGHNELPAGGAAKMIITGSWKMRTAGGEKVAAF